MEVNVEIIKVTDPEFRPYGRIIEGYDFGQLLSALESMTPLPEGCDYVPEEPVLQNLPSAGPLGRALFGGLPVQFGWCNGRNSKLNCLEYHRSSEMLLGTEDFVLLLAKETDIDGGRLDTGTVKAFRAPAGVMVELYATTLHYAPCHTDPEKGFRVLVALPMGTNTDKPDDTPAGAAAPPEARMLRANNKWLLAHPDTSEAQEGAYVGLMGPNIDIS
jgi:hypothetical protein